MPPKKGKKFIAAVDAGNGITNAEIEKGSIDFPSIRAKVTGDTFGDLDAFEMPIDWLGWANQRFVVGDDALAVTRKGHERQFGFDRYGDELHQFLIATALARLGVGASQKDEVHLCVFMPPGMYANRAKARDGFMNHNHVDITLKGTPHTWDYTDVTILPEGFAALAALLFDGEGKVVPSNVFTGNIVLLDAGMHTIDGYVIANGKLNPEALNHATHEGEGINTHIRTPLLADVKGLGKAWRTITIDDIDFALRNGNPTDGYWISPVGDPTIRADIKEWVAFHSEKYGDWVSNSIISQYYDDLYNARSLVIVGGGAYFITKRLTEIYGDKVVDISNHPTTKGVAPTRLNALGGLRFLKARQG